LVEHVAVVSLGGIGTGRSVTVAGAARCADGPDRDGAGGADDAGADTQSEGADVRRGEGAEGEVLRGVDAGGFTDEGLGGDGQDADVDATGDSDHSAADTAGDRDGLAGVGRDDADRLGRLRTR